MISWSQFCKEPLPDRQHTFWDWFHAVMKLTKEDLRPQWIDRYIVNSVHGEKGDKLICDNFPICSSGPYMGFSQGNKRKNT